MKLEDTLDDIDKDLDAFINSQKQKIRSERLALQNLQYQDASAKNQEQVDATKYGNTDETRIPESRERSRQKYPVDYNEFLFNKRKAISGSAVGDAIGRTRKKEQNGTERANKAVLTSTNGSDVNDVYQELLHKKRLQEQQYRQTYEDPELHKNERTAPRAEEFGTKQQHQHQQQSYLPFVGDDREAVKRQRQTAYRQALQKQIEENDARKRMEQGRRRSTMQDNLDREASNFSPRQTNGTSPRHEKSPGQVATSSVPERPLADTASGIPSSVPPPSLFNPYFPMVYNPYMAGLLQMPTNGMVGQNDIAGVSQMTGNIAASHALGQGTPNNATAPLDGISQQRGMTAERKISPRNDVINSPGKASPVDLNASVGRRGHNTVLSKRDYQQQLKQQIEEKKEAKKRERLEKERYDAKLKADVATYDPWGKGGAGAPIKDRRGHLVTDLRKMHQYNAEGKIISPRHQPTQVTSPLYADNKSPAAASALGLENSFNFSSLDEVMSGQEPVAGQSVSRSPRGNPLTTDGQSNHVDYKEFLRQQVEEKKRKKKEEEERVRLEEEKENRRVESQRMQMQKEFEEEQGRQKKKEIELRQQNEQLMKIAEQKRLEAEAERRKIDEARQRDQQVRAQADLENRLMQQERRTKSPPVPSHRSKQTTLSRHASATATSALGHSAAEELVLEDLTSGDYNAPNGGRVATAASADLEYLASVRRSLARSPQQSNDNRGNVATVSGNGAIGNDDLLSKLMFLRRQLDEEEHKVEQELQNHKAAYSQLRSNSSRKRRDVAFDRATGRGGSERPKAHQEATPLVQHSSAQGESSSGGTVLALPPNTDLSKQQQKLMREQEAQLQSLRDIITGAERHFRDGPSARRQPMGASHSRGSMLASDSEFVAIDDNHSIGRQSTARQRRRWSKLKEMAANDTLDGGEPLFDDLASPSRSTESTRQRLDLELVGTRNQERLKMLKEPAADN